MSDIKLAIAAVEPYRRFISRGRIAGDDLSLKAFGEAWHPEEVVKLYNELAATKQKLLAEQLHIKELREALEDSVSVLRFADGDCYDQAQCQADDNRKVLAKQPDTRALDKALLEAEIAGLSHGVHRSFTDTKNKLEERKAKLAELNKE